MSFAARFGSAVLSVSIASTLVMTPGGGAFAAAPNTLYQLTLPGGKSATVYADGVAQIYSKDHNKVMTRVLAPSPNLLPDGMRGSVPDKSDVTRQLLKEPQAPYQAGRVLVVLRDGVTASDVTTVPKAALLTLRHDRKTGTLPAAHVPSYTSDAATNSALAQIGADRVERLFRNLNRSTLRSMRAGAQAKLGRPVLDIASAYRVHITGASVRNAVARLSKLTAVAYVSPDWHVSTMQSGFIPLPAGSAARARATSYAMRSRPAPALHSFRTPQVPTNYAVAASAQSLLNAPSTDAVAAYDEVSSKFHQLPGAGQIITDVSLGDVDDASEASNNADPCSFYVSAYGPTTVLLGGQRYIDWPSMPLIPTYTSDSLGDLNGAGSVCGVDPELGEVGLDFSVMAPLPDNLQRAGETGSGLTDLMGIAPGASYRLVVPATSSPSNSDILSALLGAALQTPKPTAITMSLGFGEDAYGFPSRYFEDDPFVEALVASVVQSYDIVVAVSAGDGVRLFTTVAIGPNGGSSPTNTVAPGRTITNINDIYFSGVPSADYDSGSIDAGATTLDDVFARPPQFSSGAVAAQHAYAETRWTGFTSFSSGDGTRVNASAPGDNIVTFSHPFGGTADAVSVGLNGGTSASAPEIAAAAAVLLQVAHLTGKPLTAAQIRTLLETTGTPVPAVPQAAGVLNVGPQIDLRRAVETLFTNAGITGTPGVARVAVEQRRSDGDLDGVFESDTNPTDILLQDPTKQQRNQVSWITLAPDWEWIPATAQYRLFVTGHPTKVLAETPWARALPKTILAYAGLPLASGSNRTVSLTYEALVGAKVVATTTFPLTFGPADPDHYGLLAPYVPAVITGPTIPVTYDLRDIAGENHPELVVSEPGRMSPATGSLFHQIYTVSLAAGSHGTVDVPVSALQGGGMYGIDVIYDSTLMRHSDPAFTRVVPSGAVADEATAPLLSAGGSPPTHYLEIPYGGSFQLSYNVSNISGATGAMVEVSAAGPGAWGIYNPFNNPGGSICDNNGVDAGSVYCVPVSGTSGTVTLNGTTIGLVPTLNHVVRVIPMKYGVPAGEAGDVSALTMDGVATTDGGGIQNGFGVSQSGSDGYLTSGQETASGDYLTSLETFDQGSNLVTNDDASASGGLFFSNGGSGIFGGDIALIGLENTATYASTYNLLDTVSSGVLGAAWTPPATIDNSVAEIAENSANDDLAMYYYDPAGKTNDNYRLLTSNIVRNTFGPVIDISRPIDKEGFPNVWGLAENTTTKEAVLLGEDFLANCAAPTIITVDTTSGVVSSFLGKGTGFPYGIAVDSATDRAAVPTICDGGLTIYNLKTQAAREILLDGNPSASGNVFSGLYTENDSPHAQFLVEQTTAPDFGVNNNSLSRVLVYNEAGALVEKKEAFDLFGAFVTIQAHNLQVDPARHAGYLIGPYEEQVEPFSY
jgi:hypothetical protein